MAGCAFVIELAFLAAASGCAGTTCTASWSTTTSDGRPRAHARVAGAARARSGALVSDPYRLPRWWPGVQRVEEAADEAWTTVLGSPTRARPCAPTTRLRRVRRARSAPVWRQEVEESPFERILTESLTEIALEPDGRAARACELTLDQRLRGCRALRRAPGAARPRASSSRPRSTGWPSCSGTALMRWWGWGEDGHAVALPAGGARRCCARSSGRTAERGGRRWRSRRCALPDAAPARRAARAPGSAVGAEQRARRPRGAGRARARHELPGPGAHALRRRARARPTPWCCPASAEQVAGVLRGLRRGRRGGGAVRRRHERGGRRGAAARRLRRRRSRSTSARMDRDCSRSTATSLTARLDAGLFGPEARAPRWRAQGLTLGHFPQSFEYSTVGRLGGHPLGRPGLDRLRAHRRARGGRALRDARPASSARGTCRPPRPGRRCASWSWAPRACSA